MSCKFHNEISLIFLLLFQPGKQKVGILSDSDEIMSPSSINFIIIISWIIRRTPLSFLKLPPREYSILTMRLQGEIWTLPSTAHIKTENETPNIAIPPSSAATSSTQTSISSRRPKDRCSSRTMFSPQTSSNWINFVGKEWRLKRVGSKKEKRIEKRAANPLWVEFWEWTSQSIWWRTNWTFCRITEKILNLSKGK